jgi:hypothetical protein
MEVPPTIAEQLDEPGDWNREVHYSVTFGTAGSVDVYALVAFSAV